MTAKVRRLLREGRFAEQVLDLDFLLESH